MLYKLLILNNIFLTKNQINNVKLNVSVFKSSFINNSNFKDLNSDKNLDQY
jgi:hypothetical protein